MPILPRYILRGEAEERTTRPFQTLSAISTARGPDTRKTVIAPPVPLAGAVMVSQVFIKRNFSQGFLRRCSGQKNKQP